MNTIQLLLCAVVVGCYGTVEDQVEAQREEIDKLKRAIEEHSKQLSALYKQVAQLKKAISTSVSAFGVISLCSSFTTGQQP